MKAITLLFTCCILSTISALGQELAVLGMQNTPQKVLLPLNVNDQGFALNLYKIIEQINQVDGLTGDKRISVLAWIAKEDQSKYDVLQPDSTPYSALEIVKNLENEIRKSSPVPLLEVFQSAGSSHFAFLQDLFEPLVPTNGGPLTLLDLSGESTETQVPLMTALSAKLGASKVAGPVKSADDDGGNIEVTPEGIPYMGSTSSPQLRNEIKRLTGKEPLILPTDWLFVGHVDEMLTFLPSPNPCGSTLVYADPLEALNFMRQFQKVPLIPREDLEGMGASIRNPEEYKTQFFNSLNYFVKESAKGQTSLKLSDFDLSKPVRDISKEPNQLDIELLGNLNAFQQIQKAVGILQKSRPAQCAGSITGIPSWHYSRKGISFDLSNAPTEIKTGYTAVAGYINLVSLRNHVIFAREWTKSHYSDSEGNLQEVKRPDQGFFGPIIKKRYAKILGGDQFVHDIDASYYEKGAGSAHCVTNVIRTLEKWK